MSTTNDQHTNNPASGRSIRVFVSSTFADMHLDRTEVVNQFPPLRRLCSEHGIFWDAIELRWGILLEETTDNVIERCLAEVERCHYFIGLLGERYGTITEREIRDGVLNNPQAPRAFIYFRDPAYIDGLPSSTDTATFRCQDSGQIGKLKALKDTIRAHPGIHLRENYKNPISLGRLVYEDFSQLIKMDFPDAAKLTAAEQEQRDQEYNANRHSRVYIRRQSDFDVLDRHAMSQSQPLVVIGEPGIGKSALLANWIREYSRNHPNDAVLLHSMDAAPTSSKWTVVVGRIMAELKQSFGVEEKIPERSEDLPAFARSLEKGGARGRLVLVLDGLDKLEGCEGARELVWLPRQLPPNIRLICATVPGAALQEAMARGWQLLTLQPLVLDVRRKLITALLSLSAKKLDARQMDKIAALPQAGNPLYLYSLLKELCRFGKSGEALDIEIEHLSVSTISVLYQRIVANYERDYGTERPHLVRDLLRFISASRNGLSESELADLLGDGEKPLSREIWSPLFWAMMETFLADRAGLLGFAHDQVGQEMGRFYLPTESTRKKTHWKLARYFDNRSPRTRREYDELPWQVAEAGAWDVLAGALRNPRFLTELWEISEYDVRSYWKCLEANSSWRITKAYRNVAKNVGQNPMFAQVVSRLLHLTAHYRESLAIEQGLIKLLENHDLPSNIMGLAIASSLDHEARISLEQGDLERALQLNQQAEKLFRQVDNQHDLAKCLGNQVNILRLRREFNKALEVAEEQCQIYEGVGESQDLSDVLENVAIVYQDMGKFEAALQFHKQAEDLYRAQGNQDGIAGTMLSQARIAIEKGDLAEAKRLLEGSAEIYSKTGNWQRLATALGNWANIDPERCDALYQKEERLCREVGNHAGLARSLGNQAISLARRGETQRAIELLEQAEQIHRDLKDQWGVNESLGRRSFLLSEQGKSAEALELLESEEILCRDQGNSAGLIDLLAAQGDILANEHKSECALPLFIEQEKLCREIGNAVGQAEALAKQAILHHLQKRLSKAIQCAMQAHQLAWQHDLSAQRAHFGPILDAASAAFEEARGVYPIAVNQREIEAEFERSCQVNKEYITKLKRWKRLPWRRKNERTLPRREPWVCQ